MCVSPDVHKVAMMQLGSRVTDCITSLLDVRDGWMISLVDMSMKGQTIYSRASVAPGASPRSRYQRSDLRRNDFTQMSKCSRLRKY